MAQGGRGTPGQESSPPRLRAEAGGGPSAFSCPLPRRVARLGEQVVGRCAVVSTPGVPAGPVAVEGVPVLRAVAAGLVRPRLPVGVAGVEVSGESPAAQVPHGVGRHSLHLLVGGGQESQPQTRELGGRRQGAHREIAPTGLRLRHRRLREAARLRELALREVRRPADAAQGAGQVEGRHGVMVGPLSWLGRGSRPICATAARSGRFCGQPTVRGSPRPAGSGSPHALPLSAGALRGRASVERPLPLRGGQKVFLNRIRRGRPSGSSRRR